MRIWRTALAAGVAVALLAETGQAQQVTVGTPFRTLQDHFFENNSINWSGNYRGFTFSFGAPGLSTPQFGSPEPGAGLTTNFAFVGKNGQINFNVAMGQGYTQSATTQVPSVTIMNGQQGTISDTSLTPYVISVIPVVGGFPEQLPPVAGFEPPDPRIDAMMRAHADAEQAAAAQAAAAKVGGMLPPTPQRPNNLAPQRTTKVDADPMASDQEKPAEANRRRAVAEGQAIAYQLSAAQDSTAGRPAVSVAEAKRLRKQELAKDYNELAAMMERAEALEEDGQPRVAKIYYQQIAQRATGELQQKARDRLYELQK
jgi:hypothetical protein